MGILIAIIVYLVLFGTPFLIGWNIIEKKRPRDAGDCVAAIVLLLIYLGISFFLLIVINESKETKYSVKQAIYILRTYTGCTKRIVSTN